MDKAWIGTETPCDEADRQLFAACTTITIGDRNIMSFWYSGWLFGRRPKDIAPSLFRLTKSRRRNVADALSNGNWIRDLNIANGITTSHLQEFVILWNLIHQIQLRPRHADQICWKFTESGNYTAASAYRAQFLGSTREPHLYSIWCTWALPKCKLFGWLILQDRVWTSDRLARRGWDHSPDCPLCHQTLETAKHLLADCRYTRRIWEFISSWTQQPSWRTREWRAYTSLQDWWGMITTSTTVSRKAGRSITLLVIWEVWKERNARVFRRQEAPTLSLVASIKAEAATWTHTGEKDRALLISRD